MDYYIRYNQIGNFISQRLKLKLYQSIRNDNMQEKHLYVLYR
ncbi:MAG: hypothetical protein PUJ69_06785 [Porphyromonas somerae]|nr:hypothetical protein [Porphyromonas somerae]MDD7558360.1 hypothetical protein [Porphyromonas somerae]MDY3885341.1 hypothetical protein [Porphyromonas somerae]MDY5815940.1 hypothetical protein [Porphyromonas somerae]